MKLFRLIKHFKRFHAPVNIHPTILRFSQMLTICFCFIHFIACIWYLIGTDNTRACELSAMDPRNLFHWRDRGKHELLASCFMFLGTFVFSFLTAITTSALNEYDKKGTTITQKLESVRYQDQTASKFAETIAFNHGVSLEEPR